MGPMNVMLGIVGFVCWLPMLCWFTARPKHSSLVVKRLPIDPNNSPACFVPKWPKLYIHVNYVYNIYIYTCACVCVCIYRKMKGHECTLESKWKEYERKMNGNEHIWKEHERTMKGNDCKMKVRCMQMKGTWTKMHTNECKMKGTWSVAEAPETNKTTPRSIFVPL